MSKPIEQTTQTRRERKHGEADAVKRNKARIDTVWVNNQVEERYQETLTFLTHAYLTMSKTSREKQAREISCMNRQDRRRNGIR